MSPEEDDGILGFGILRRRRLRPSFTKDWDRKEEELKEESESEIAVGLGKRQRLTKTDMEELEEISRVERRLKEMSDSELCFELERSIFTSAYDYNIASYPFFIINSYVAPRLARALSRNDSLTASTICNCLRKIRDKSQQGSGVGLIEKIHSSKWDPQASSFRHGLQLLIAQLLEMCSAVSR